MRYSVKPFLLGGVAATAITVGGLGAAPAAAQCVTSGSTVTCNGATTDTQAQQAINGATPPNLTFNVNQGTTIASVQRQISVPNVSFPTFVPPNGFVNSPAFTGTVAVNNAGVIGTSSTQTTDILVAGASRFTGLNSGVINGSVIVGSQFGGASTAGSGSFANTGTVTGTISLRGSGDQSYTGDGAIQGGPFAFTGLTLASRASTTTSASDGTQSTTVTGGLASATVDGILRSTGAQPNFLRVSVTGFGGATAAIGGTTGAVTVTSLDANTAFRSTSSFQGGFSSTSVNNSQALGDAATLTVNPAATVNGVSSITGFTSATATVNGTMLSGGQSFGAPLLSVTANATDTTFSQSQSQSGAGPSFASSFQSASTSTSRGGAASVTVGAGANVAGGVSVTGGSTASATVNGSIGGTSFPNNLTVAAGAVDSTFNSSSRSDASGGSSSSSGIATQREGTASATVGATGAVLGAVQVTGISNASATIVGTVGTAQNPAGVSVIAQGSDTTSSSSGSFSATTGSTNTNTHTRTSRAGSASAAVTATGRVVGGVGVSGGTSATATIDGAVGSASNPFGGVFVSAGGTDGTTTTTFTVFSDSGAPTQTQEGFSSARGGAATVTVGATGSVIGSVSASSNRGPASATLAGRAGVANPQSFSPTPSFSAIATGVDTRGTSTSGPGRNAFSNSSTAVGGQATATVLAGGVMSGDVVATGDADATLVNAGSVVGALRATAGSANTTSSSDNTGSATTTGGVATFTNRSISASSSTPVAADASVTNTGSAGSVAATATGNMTFRNDGTVAEGGGELAATATSTTSNRSDQRVTTTTPATGGGTTTVTTNTVTNSSTSQSVGGNVVATYNGTVGTNPTDPRQAQRTEITQTANDSSAATLAGVAFADVTSSTGGLTASTNDSTVTTTTTQPLVGAGTPAATETTVVTNRGNRTVTGGPSSVTVSGAVRNNGAGTGDVTVQATTGSASATVNGGVIEGALAVNAGQGQNTTSTLDRTTTSTRAASTNFFSPFVEQSASATSSTTMRLGGGTATATLTGARLGSVRMSGVGTGAGSAAATASVDAASTTGAFTVAAGGIDTREDQTNTLANGVRTIVTTRTDTVSALAGDARADVAGRIGGAAAVTSQGGGATLNLTGVAADAVSMTASTFDRSTTTTQTFAVTSPQGFQVSRRTAQTIAFTTTARGGVATLAVASSSALQGAGINAVGGAVTVDGFGGSVLTVAAGSRVLTKGGAVRVVGTAANATASTTSSFDPNSGAFAGSTTRQTFTPVAGPASITNAGVIGAPTAYFSAPTPVRAESVGGATIANSGQIFGNVTAAGLGERRDVTTVLTPTRGTTPQTRVATTIFMPLAGTARIANTGVISGRAEVVGGTGSITNAGVIRGVAQLGTGVRNYTNTVTSTIAFDANGNLVTTSVTSPATPPSALFAQTLTLDQNGLLLGGVRVEGATTADPVTGAPIRTSTTAATVNLNQGSVTLGDVTGQQDASGRLTSTAVNLTGEGFLGAGPTLQAVQPASGGVSFAAAPNYAAFAAIDPALGAAGAGGFTPAVTLASGSRISGVDSVTKTGGGAFTIVGAPLLRGAGLSTFTVDAPLVRVASGELQLGVAGVDSATGQGVFGVRGAVQNDGVLVVGRRIASGAQSGVQGLTLSVAGNVTQSAGGTLVLAASPTPALQTAPALATTPSFLSVDGVLSLAGVVSIAAPQGIYVNGRGPDIASVGGAFTSTGTVNAFASPFVGFGLVTRTEGGRTIVSLDVTRTPYVSVAANVNAAAAAGALQAGIPAAITAGAGSDLATVIVGLDTGSAGRAAGALDELGQASFYGSLAAVSTTRPFGEVTDALASIDTDPERPVSLWARMGGAVARTRGDAGTGARQLTANGYGAIVGLGVTGGGVSAGIGVGPGWTDASAEIGRVRANGWMLGAYAAGRIGMLSLAGQAVAGWSSWNASRNLQSFGRFATTGFDGREIRLNGRAALDLSMGEVALSPFAGLEWRHWRLDGFSEQNAGVLGVSSGRTSKSILAPELGARASGTRGALRAFMEGAYVFQPDIGSARAVSLVGAPVGFVAQGVTPGDFGRIGGGLETDIGRGSIFVRSDVWTGGGNRLGAVRVGARVRL